MWLSDSLIEEWNNIFTGRTAADVNQNCSLFDPYIGLGAGYVQVGHLIFGPSIIIDIPILARLLL